MPGPPPQSCSACRQGKRKCSGERPECSFCARKQIKCSYPSGVSSSSKAFIAGELPGPSDLRCQAYFLDAESMQFSHLEGLSPKCTLPDSIRDEIEQNLALFPDMDSMNTYFESIHTFFPIRESHWRTDLSMLYSYLILLVVSKSRLAQEFAATQENGVPGDLYILIMAMHLFSQPVETPNFPITSLYFHLKSCLTVFEAQRMLSFRAFQAQLLLTLFEVAHALYPAAFVNVAHCACIGQILRLNEAGSKSLPRLVQIPASWVALEEHRRSWYGLLVLDRLSKIGSPSPLVCEDMKPHDLLPAEDEYWDSGDPLVAHALAASSDISLSASPFARTCQATHLLSKVLHQIRNDDQNPVAMFQQAMHIHGILSSFRVALWQELSSNSEPLNYKGDTALDYQTAMLTPIAIVLSADQLLCYEYSCADLDRPETVGIREQIEMQRTALSALETLFRMTREFAKLVIDSCSAGKTSSIGPLVCDCLYQTVRTATFYMQETEDPSLSESMLEISKALKMLGARWNVANTYLDILNAKKI